MSGPSLAQIVAQGGVYWKCRCCDSCGVVTADSPLSATVRTTQGVPAPAPCCVEFTNCDEHPVKEVLCVS